MMLNKKIDSMPAIIRQMMSVVVDQNAHSSERFNNYTMLINIKDVIGDVIYHYDTHKKTPNRKK